MKSLSVVGDIGALFDVGGTFANAFGGAGLIDGFTVDLQPRSNLAETDLNLSRDGAVRTWTNVKKQVAILGDDVDQLMEDAAR